MLAQKRSFVTVLLLCLGACAGTSLRPEGAFVSLQVQTTSEGATGWRPIAPKEALHSGDRFDLKIEVSRSVYLYVLKHSGGGPAEVLLPSSSGVQYQARPDMITHLPAGGGWFRVIGEAGREDLYVVASARPLAADKVKRELDRAREAPERDRDDPRDPPTGCGSSGCWSGDRGYDKVRNVLWGRLDRRGIAVLRFPIWHK